MVLGKIQMLLRLKEKSKKQTDNKKMRYIANLFFWLRNAILLIIFLRKRRKKQVTLTAASLIFTARAGFCLRAIFSLVTHLGKCDTS